MTSSSSAQYFERIDFSFPRKVNQDINRWEELERKERIEKGVDPVLFGKIHRLHPSIINNKVQIADEKKTTIRETLKGKAQEWSEKVAETTKSFVGSAKDKFGLQDPAALASIIKAEEKERIRRMNEKVDPSIEASKHKMENELLQKVKSVN